ncbi:MAG: DUF1565 domain-containing protein [Bacteroidetes bacterium]|nr:DUF1565 domain-containing protein [Bacteroidota bacterium]
MNSNIKYPSLFIRYGLGLMGTLFLIFITNQNLKATTFTVKQDGTGDFIVIQNAIDFSNNGDTVLVWPGTYYENLVISEKIVILGSLTLTTGNTTYMYETIINGNKTGSCIKIDECPGNIIIEGFAFTNGSGTYIGGIDGGGVFIFETNTTIKNCIVSDNQANAYGGGIYSHNSNIFLSGVTIKNNHAYDLGGGITLGNSICEFDTINLCNIYNNTAAWGTDIYNLSYPTYYNHVVVDTFTVIDPDNYYIYSNNMDSLSPGNSVTWEIQNGKNEQFYENLYVSPNGDNNNSGLSADEPLKNIWFALLKMASDSISPDTIILADGVYSFSTGERFPLSLKHVVSIKGTSRDGTILDAGDEVYLMNGIYYADNYTHSNFTLRNGNGNKNIPFGYGAISLIENNNASFENILFTSNTGESSPGGSIYNSNNFVLKNVEFRDNLGRALLTGHGDGYVDGYDTVYIDGCKFINNNPDYTVEFGGGGGLSVIGQISPQYAITCVLTNTLFVTNHTKDINNGPGSSGIGIIDQSKAYIVNCTFADNTSDNSENAAIGVLYGSEMHVYNSIVYNNQYKSAYMYTQDWTGECNLFIKNTLIDEGEDGIVSYTPYNNLYYYPTNINTDPLFYEGAEFPYNLSQNSPCIDAGTLDIPGWIALPEFDLAGNPRLYGDSIDMGAYEWNPTVGIGEHQLFQKEEILQAGPNPFSSSTKITIRFTSNTNVKLEVYNNYGQQIRLLSDVYVRPGTSQLIWDGLDNNGKSLPSGVYNIVLFENGKQRDELKIIKL